MPNKEPGAKKKERGEHDEKVSDRGAADEDRESEKKKKPEPTGNLRRRGDWFQKRH